MDTVIRFVLMFGELILCDFGILAIGFVIGTGDGYLFLAESYCHIYCIYSLQSCGRKECLYQIYPFPEDGSPDVGICKCFWNSELGIVWLGAVSDIRLGALSHLSGCFMALFGFISFVCLLVGKAV